MSWLKQRIDLAEEIKYPAGEVIELPIWELLTNVEGSVQSRFDRIRVELVEGTLEAPVELLKCLVHAGLENTPHDFS